MVETLAGLIRNAGIDWSSVRGEQTSGAARPEQWFIDLMGGQKTYSGKAVSPSSALTSYATVYGCVRILATVRAAMPLNVFRWRADGGTDLAKNHWAYSLLHDAPNDEMSSYTMRMYVGQNEAMWGNGYILPEWNGAGKLKALWPLRPDWMEVYRSQRDGKKWYWYQPAIGPREGLYRPDEIIHTRGLGDDLVGFSPIEMARQNIGTAQTAEEFSGSLFANGARVGGILEVQGKLDPAKRDEVQSSFDEKYAGAAKAGKTLIIDQGSKFVATSIPPNDAQYLELRSFESGVISSKIYGIPPWLIGDVEKQTSWGTGVEQMSIGFVTFTLNPQLKCLEDEITLKILGGDFYAKHNVSSLMRGDFAGRVAALVSLVQNGIFTANEARAKEDMNPLEGGDVLRAQIQNQPLTSAPTK